jgi:large subunit ribosomal protein L6
MSRVGKKPISIPDKTKVTYKDRVVTVQGKNGTLTQEIHPAVEVNVDKDVISVSLNDQSRKTMALQGMTRSLLNNMVIGVSDGFERVLEINGIGYRAEVKGKSIIFNLGFSHPIDFALPAGVSAKVDKSNTVRISGIDKQLIGQTAARIRQLRPPEPYKGKGIKYAEEHIMRKAGKTGTK